MNEQDREYIEDIAKQMGQMPETFDASVVMKLWGIIDGLDKQLTGVMEAGEPVLKEIELYAKILQKKLCCYGSVQGEGFEPSGRCDCKFIKIGKEYSTEKTGCCEARQIILISRRLAKVLKGVKEVMPNVKR